ncbi:MAG: C40 family peptidase [Clostridiales bacterium]|jgi:cell wall-associated NlpC family hydrolase|nr:C40 family peptidase [Clostridiales bacterium]
MKSNDYTLGSNLNYDALIRKIKESDKSKAAKTITLKSVGRTLVIGTVFTSCAAVNVFAQTAVVNTDQVNIYTSASSDAAVIKSANAGDSVTITSLDGDFFEITYGDFEKLYIKTQYLDIQDMEVTAPLEEITTIDESDIEEISAPKERYAVVKSSDGLNLRRDPSEDSEIFLALPDGAAVDVIDSWDIWTKVQYEGTVGFMRTAYVELRQGKAPQQESGGSSGSGIADEVISYSKQFLGTPYKWAGTSLSKGVDCSGFVYSIYKHFGVNLNRSSSSMVSNGSRVKKDNLKKGDLLFFDTNGKNNGSISHVGIYIGNGQFIHSSSSRRTWGVTISSLSEDYYVRTYVTASRVI